jgi:branched-chain amino acid transport system substrate-binding protein
VLNKPMRWAGQLFCIGLVLSACSSSAKSSSPPSSQATGSNVTAQPGATLSPITIGLDTSLTGPGAAGYPNAVKGAQARFDLQNAQGGVGGRKINLIVADDGSTPTGAQTAVDELVQVKKVFGLIFVSAVTTGAYKLPQQLGVPVVGAPFDGPEWGEQPNTNMVSTYGDVGTLLPVGTWDAEAAKLSGATNMAVVAIAGIPSAQEAAHLFVTAAKAIGLKVGYLDLSLPLGSVNATPVVLAMKNAGVDGFDSLILESSAIAIMTTAKQAGLNLKAPLLSAGYGQDLLSPASTLQAAQGAITSVNQVPFEENTPATRAEQAAFQKYANFSGVPDENWTEGWVAADIWIKGLEEAGANPTRPSFLNAIHSTTGYTAGGLLPASLDFSLKDFGKNPPTDCGYFAKLQGSTFVPLNRGKPLCGTVVNP